MNEINDAQNWKYLINGSSKMDARIPNWLHRIFLDMIAFFYLGVASHNQLHYNHNELLQFKKTIRCTSANWSAKIIGGCSTAWLVPLTTMFKNIKG